MVERYKYKCIDAYEEPENPMEWLPCPRCNMAGGSGASPRRAMDAGRRGTGVFLWIDRG